MEIRRYKDIVAFKWGQKAPIGFHSRNMEVAEMSLEAFQALSPTAMDQAEFLNLNPDALSSDLQALRDLRQWQDDVNPEAKDLILPQKIRSLTLNVTQICNLHCTYCAAGGDGTYGEAVVKLSVEKTLPQLQLFMSRLEAGDTFHITFLGGEPLLYPEALVAIHNYNLLMTAGRQIELSYSIITNGTLITEEMLRLLSPLKAQYTLSFDGPKDIQDKMRPQKNGGSSFEQTMRGFELLLQHKEWRSRLLIHSVFTATQTAVKRSYLFFSEFPVDAYEFTFDVTSGDREASQAFTRELQEVAELAYARGGEQELRKITLFDQYFRLLDSQTRNLNHCGSGKSLLSIDSKNRIFTCPLEVSDKSKTVGSALDIKEESYKDLASKNLVDLNSCQNCWAQSLCGGGCMFVHQSLTGNKHRKDVSYCERQRNLISTALLYYYTARAEKGLC